MHDINDNYFSMMGLMNESNLKGRYSPFCWSRFNSLNDVLAMMPKNETGTEDKHSIPDIYGRAIQYKISFESAQNKSIKNNDYFYTNEILNWRGIITIIALQDFLELNMKIEIVTYTDDQQAFDKALKHPPTAELFVDEKNWEKSIFHILALKGDDATEHTDIAMFSQLTVFYPIADLERKMPKVTAISWFDYENKKFLNPTTSLTDTEKMIVVFWAQNLIQILREQGDAAGSVLYHLYAYINELKADVNINNYTCFALKTYDLEYANSVSTTLNNILNQTVQLQLNIGDNNNMNYKDLFADQIYYTRQTAPFAQNPFIENHCIEKTGIRGTGSDQWQAFLPLGKKVTEIKDWKIIHNLAHNIKMQVIYDMKSKPEYIHVRLALSRIYDSVCDAEKKYYFSNPDEIVEQKNNFPVISVWPSTYILECNKYYIYLQGGMTIQDGKTSKIEVALADAESASNPYAKSVNSFPVAISLQRIPEGGKKSYDIGLVIPEYNNEPQQKGVAITAVVGIDFGTSGTTVYVQIPNKTPFPIKIWEDNSSLLTSAGKTELAFMNQWFLANTPDVNASGKLHSVYRRASKTKLKTVIPILDGIIYQANEKEMIEASDQYMPDIKWNDPMNGSYYEAFIEELCLHIWMKLRNYGVTAVKWRYAFPSSLNQKELYQSIWKQKIQEFVRKNISNVNHIFGEWDYTESEAVSLYFQNSAQIEMVNTEKGYVVVDIGGGSTDIAVWQKQNPEEDVTMISQISVPVAGRMLFIRWLAANLLTIKREIFPDKNELEQLTEFKEDIDIVNAVLERIIYTNHDTIMRAYYLKSQWAMDLKNQLEFGVALLFFALGSFIGYLQQNGSLKVQGTRGAFSIALGGNGSKILDWLDTDDRSKLLVLFQEGIQSRGIYSEPYSPQIITSVKPKEEVALGLLQDNKKTDKAPINVEETITAQMAIKWNGVFLKKYNELFEKNINVAEDDILALMANHYKPTNICDFFMTIMYKEYYKKRIILLKGDKL